MFGAEGIGILENPLQFLLINEVTICDLKKLNIIISLIDKRLPMAEKQIFSIISDDFVINKIYEIRGYKVMLDSDLAELYGVETKVMNQSIKRNLDRFPEYFMFKLTE